MYKEYVRGLRNSIKSVRKAILEGVQLSFLEELDYNFKRELLYHATGVKRYREGFLKSKLNVDYRVASFLAECFDDIMSVYAEDEYSFKELKEMAKSYCFSAWKQGITTGRYTIDSYDKNNVLYLTLIIDRVEVYEFPIKGIKSAVSRLIELVSFLGSEGYTEGKYQDSVESYLPKVLRDVFSNKSSKPLADTDVFYKTLADYIKNNAVKSTGRSSMSIIHLGEDSDGNTSKGKVIPYTSRAVI